MKKCPACGRECQDTDLKCPGCGSYVTKIAELIAEEEEAEERRSFRGHCKRILASDDVKQALTTEFKQIKAGLSKKSLFTIYVIIAFVFALTLSVL